MCTLSVFRVRLSDLSDVCFSIEGERATMVRHQLQRDVDMTEQASLQVLEELWGHLLEGVVSTQSFLSL